MPTPPTNDPRFRTLTDLVRRGSCIAILGAGVSEGDYPLWPELIAMLQERCELRPEDVRSPDPLDIAEAAKHRNPSEYHDTLDEIFAFNNAPQRAYRYHMLARIKFKSIMTLNFDPLLLRIFDLHRNVYVSQYPHLKTQYVDGEELFYLHGRLGEGRPAESTEIVLTRSEFEEAYDPNQQRLHSFLQQLFLDNHVCFLGCNPDQPNLRKVLEICEKFCENRHGFRDSARPGWFLLTEGGKKLSEGLESKCGIHPVRYDKVDDSFTGLDDVLKYWAGKKDPEPRRAGVAESPYSSTEEPEP